MRIRHLLGLRLGRGVVVGAMIAVALVAATGAKSPAASARVQSTTISFGTLESVARAANGDTVEINGEGTFALHPKSVSGDGGAIEAALGAVPRSFTHRDSDGNVRAEGTWEPISVLSYQSFGPATPEQDAQFGGLPPGSEGGKVMMKISLLVGGVQVHEGILTIVCHLGEPHPQTEEATLLQVQGTRFNFNEVVSGDNLFIRE